jgi:glutaredoxin-like protein
LAILPDNQKTRLENLFASKLDSEVKIVVFSQEFECEFCKDTIELVEELAQTSPKIKIVALDFSRDKEKAKEFGVDKIPAIALVGKRGYGIRFYGIPTGYEFASLIEDIVDVSTGRTRLSPQTKEKLQKINKAIHIQVFVTPTCPYCPQAVRLAHQFAIENTLIRADMIEAIEFPFLTQRYSVMGVPKVVINETINFVGALPEERFIEYVLTAQSRTETHMFT